MIKILGPITYGEPGGNKGLFLINQNISSMSLAPFPNCIFSLSFQTVSCSDITTRSFALGGCRYFIDSDNQSRGLF